MKPFASRTALHLFVCLLLATGAFAGTTGKIAGKITDSGTGEGLPGAIVVIEGTSMGASADPDGFYSIINVPPGTYNLSYRLVGYSKTTVQKVEVNVDRTAKVDVKLVSESVNMKEVVVQAERPVIERDRTQTASIVTSQTIEAMPVTEVSEVIQLQAGVTVGSGGELHFRGGRSREVGYLIDGIPISNAYSQGGGYNVQVENSMVQEIEVISGTFNAEYGSAQSGVVNIVTKAPEAKMTGFVQAYTGDWLSDHTSQFIGINKIDPLANKDIQATLSGPLLAEKLGYSATMRYNNSQSYLWYQRRFMPTDGWKIDAYQKWYSQHNAGEAVSAIYIPDSLKTGDMSEGPLDTYKTLSLSGKLNYAPSATFKIGYQIFGSWGTTVGGDASRRYQPDQVPTYKDWSQHHFLTFRLAPTDAIFMNLRVSYQHNMSDSYYRKDNLTARAPGMPGIQPISSSSQGFSLGTTPGFYTGLDGKNYRDLYLLNGDFNWQVDRYNFIKGGFEIKQHNINTYSRGPVATEQWSQYMYTNTINGANLSWPEFWGQMVNYWDTLSIQRYRPLADSEVTRYRDYTIRPLEMAAYIQDKIEMGEIVLNAGLRLDMFQPNENMLVDTRVESYLLGMTSNQKKAPIKWQLSPRLGLSFPISAAGAFHVAYGHFFQMPSFEKIYNVPINVMSPIQLQGITLGDAGIQPERTIAYEIGVQQGVTEDVAVDVTAFYKDIRNLLGIERVITIDGVGYNRYINRDYGNVKGLTISLRKGGGFVSGSLNYSLQIAKGSASSPDYLQLVETSTRVGGQAVQFVERQILPLEWDQTHTFNAVLTFSKPDNWSMSLLGNVGTGMPYSPTFVERYDMPAREYNNAGRKPLQWTVDLKAKKFIDFAGLRYTIFLKVDNLFDVLNENYVYSGSGSATYNPRVPNQEAVLRAQLAQAGLFTLNEVDNQPTWYSMPRRVQLGIEVNF